MNKWKFFVGTIAMLMFACSSSTSNQGSKQRDAVENEVSTDVSDVGPGDAQNADTQKGKDTAVDTNTTDQGKTDTQNDTEDVVRDTIVDGQNRDVQVEDSQEVQGDTANNTDSGSDIAASDSNEVGASDTEQDIGVQKKGWYHLMDFGEEDYAFKILKTEDGYVVVGSTDGGGNLKPGMLALKLDFQGEVKWIMGYGDSKEDSLKAVARAADGGYYFTGYYYPKDRNDSDMVILKVDKKGNLKWRKLINDKEDDEGWGIIGLDDGGCIAVGLSFDTDINKNNARVVRLDADGNVVWNKAFGGDKNDEAKAIVKAWEGDGYVVLGNTQSFGEGMHDMWVFKLDKDGNVKWATTIGGAPEDYGYAIIRTRDEKYAAVGATGSYATQPERDVWLVKLSKKGDKIWDAHYGFPAGDIGRGPNEYGYDLIQLDNGDFVIAGSMVDLLGDGGMHGLIVRADSTGKKLWMYKYGIKGLNSNDMDDITQSKDGLYGIVESVFHTFVVVGYSKFKETRSEDLWIEDVDSDGSAPHQLKSN